MPRYLDTKLYDLSKEELYDLYVTQGKSLNELSKLLVSYPRAIKKRLDELGIKRDDTPPYQNREVLYDLYVKKNMTLKEIGDKFGVTESTISHFTRKFGLEKDVRGYYPTPNLSKELLYELYIEKDLSSNEIGKMLNLSGSSILRRLNELGIKKEEKLYKDRDWLYRERVLQRRTLEDIARECKASKHTIRKYIELYEIPDPPKIPDIEVEILCHRCKEPMTRTIGHLRANIRRGIYKMHCKDCLSEIRREKFLKENNPLYKGGQVEVSCTQCGKKFKVDPYRKREYDAGIKKPFCSMGCRSLYVYLSDKYVDTTIEIAMENEFKRRNIPYVKQYAVNMFAADFYLPDYNLIIECDGDYWHSLDHQITKDKRKNSHYQTLGYSVYRYWEHEIKEDVSACVDDILHNIENGVKLRIKKLDGTIQKTIE